MGPIFFLAERLSRSGRRTTLVLGAGSRVQLPEIDIPSGVDYRTCTQDGSAGYAGTTVDLVDEYLRQGAVDDTVIYTCGPEAMMHRLTQRAEEREIPIWVSMEQTMGCAVGACLGCVVRIRGEQPYARVCTEGPVFDGRQILWT